jgi:hypothetical protein
MYVVNNELIASHYPPFQKEVPAPDKASRRQDFEVGRQIYESDIYKLDSDQFFRH